MAQRSIDVNGEGQCILVIVGAILKGNTELVGFVKGVRAERGILEVR